MKVKFIHNKGIENSYLTFDKIYDVIKYDKDKFTIIIKNDNEELDEYYYSKPSCFHPKFGLIAFDWFEDATPYIREEKLNQLLNEDINKNNY